MSDYTSLHRARTTTAGIAAIALAIGLAGGCLLHSLDQSARAEDSPDQLARAGVERFYAALAGQSALDETLGGAFQVMRSDGTRYDRAGYLANPPSAQSFSLDGFQTTQSQDLLVTTFFATITSTIEGKSREADSLPRLAVLSREDGEWKLQALANLLQGENLSADEDAREAVDVWLNAASSGDPEKLRQVLAPEFQIVRANGSAYTGEEYLASDLMKFAKQPEYSDLVATGHGDHLIARYNLLVDATLDGQAVEQKAPRLTVFRRAAGKWLIVSHANFAAIEEAQ